MRHSARRLRAGGVVGDATPSGAIAVRPTQGPYSAPPPSATPASHRRASAPVVVGGVFGAVAVAAIVGILIGTLHSGSPMSAPVGPVAKATPSAAPTSPPPAPSAAPAGNILDEKYLSSPIPDGFTVKDHTPTTIHLTSSDGDIYIDTGTLDPSDPAASQPGLVNQDLAGDQKYSSDANVCVPAADGNFGNQNIRAQAVTICGNWTPSTGQAFPFNDGYVQALSMYQGKPLVMRVELFHDPSKSPDWFTKSAGIDAILRGVVFKLYGAT